MIERDVTEPIASIEFLFFSPLSINARIFRSGIRLFFTIYRRFLMERETERASERAREKE